MLPVGTAHAIFVNFSKTAAPSVTPLLDDSVHRSEWLAGLEDAGSDQVEPVDNVESR